MAMHQPHRVGGAKRWHTSQHFIKSDPQRIKIGTVIERAVHAPGLFRRQIRQRAFQMAGALQLWGLAGKLGGNPEINDLHLASFKVHDQIGRINVFVDQVPLMNLVQTPSQGQGQCQKSFQWQSLIR